MKYRLSTEYLDDPEDLRTPQVYLAKTKNVYMFIENVKRFPISWVEKMLILYAF